MTMGGVVGLTKSWRRSHVPVVLDGQVHMRVRVGVARARGAGLGMVRQMVEEVVGMVVQMLWGRWMGGAVWGGERD